jgi:hypothetical protein
MYLERALGAVALPKLDCRSAKGRHSLAAFPLQHLRLALERRSVAVIHSVFVILCALSGER